MIGPCRDREFARAVFDGLTALLIVAICAASFCALAYAAINDPSLNNCTIVAPLVCAQEDR